VILDQEEKPSLDDIAHFGVRGMKWGVRKNTHGSSQPSNRQLNRASKAREKAARDAEIDAARKRYNTSARKNYVKAKAQFEIDKKNLGSREARKILNKVKDKNIRDFETASQAKSGRETTKSVLGTVGLISVAILANAAVRS
jgi:hypothetical protein